jgi:predicted DNA-binding protein (MmcQ/YjbR family)
MSKDARKAAEEILEFALGFPGAYEDFPWGERVIKVGKKVFVFMGKVEDAGAGFLTFGVKLPVSGADALELPNVEPAGYGLGKSGWVTARFDPGEHVPKELVMRWIDESYRTVAPKKLVAERDRSTTSGQ